ncbi:MAG: regulatory protein RecX [Candidatus Eisenbacteria bacterium]|nr:regulatory protein RecX [Candidatus Eisenbacteria bacterium]
MRRGPGGITGTLAEERARDPEAAREAALKLLERTRRTRSDLARRLREKGYAAPVVESVIERLGAVGLVDDAEYALAFLAERWGRRAAGWRRLEQDLRRRGIAADAIAAARARFEAERGSADEAALARRVVAQAARRLAALEPRVRRQRLYALLARRGFDGDVIEQVIRDDPGRERE